MKFKIGDIIKKSHKQNDSYIIIKIIHIDNYPSKYCNGKVLCNNKYLVLESVDTVGLKIKDSAYKIEKLTEEQAFLEMI